jgi:putative cardiolipin synthase
MSLALRVVAAVILLGACASLPKDPARTPSQAMTGTGDTRLGRALASVAAAHPGFSGAYPLASGVDAFTSRLVLAAAADRSLDVQYYIWHDDNTGRVLLEALLDAADRGVRVRLLIDDLGTAAKDEHMVALDRHPNVEVRLFNPVSARGNRTLGMLMEFGRVNRRMHNKSFTADNQATIVGGRNIGDEYFEARTDLDFADMDVLSVGPVVREVSAAFDQYWNSPSAVRISALSSAKVTDEQAQEGRALLKAFGESQRDSVYAQAMRTSELLAHLKAGDVPFFWCRAQAYFDDPAKVEQDPSTRDTHLLPRLAPLVEDTRGLMLVISPYFVPGKEGVEYFRRMRERGVRIVVLTNSLAATDVAAVHAGYARYRKALLDIGVELYEIKPTARTDEQRARKSETKQEAAGLGGSSRASLHAKVFAFDRRTLFVGSLNLDPRSSELNTEIGIAFESPELAGLATDGVLEKLPVIAYRVLPGPDGRGLVWVENTGGREVRYDSEPQAGIWRRTGVWFLQWLPIESQL